MKLFGQDFHPRVRRIQVAASYAELELTIEDYNPIQVTENEKRKYLRANPTGSIPMVETPEGPLYETNAILRYIGRHSKRPSLYGSNIFEQALVDQWLDWGLTELEPHVIVNNLPYLGMVPHIKEISEKAQKNLEAALEILEEHLKNKGFLVQKEITIADIQLASILHFSFQWLFDEKYRERIPNITKWYKVVTNEKVWQKEYGRPILCKTPLKL